MRLGYNMGPLGEQFRPLMDQRGTFRDQYWIGSVEIAHEASRDQY